MTTYPEPNSSQVAITPPGGQQMWPGTAGHVTALRYSFAYPGGPDKMSCLLEVPAAFRSRMLAIGATVKVYRGGNVIWAGVLDQPEAGQGGRAVTATGVANLAADYLAVWTTWPTGQPDQVVNNAIARGLPWAASAVGQPSGIWLGQQPDSGSRTVKDVLDLACSRGGLGWYVNPSPGTAGNVLTVAPLPTAVTRLLVVTSPVARTAGEDVRAIYIRYQSAADDVGGSTAATYGLTSVTNTGHGGTERFLDLSSAGVMTQAAAQAVGTNILKIYQRSGWGGTFDVAPGLLLTTGGAAVDPGTEQAGGVYRLVMDGDGDGGEVSPLVPPQFTVAAYEWDDHARRGTVTPFQAVDRDLSSLLGRAQESPVSVTVA